MTGKEDRRDVRDEDAPIAGLAGLRRVDPPPSLVAGVMRRIAEPAPPSFWGWLRRPFVIEVRVSRLGIATTGLCAALGLALLLASPGPATAPEFAATAPAAAPAPAAPAGGARPVLVRLRFQAQGARRVAVAGSFNEWSTDSTWLRPTAQAGVFVGTVALPPGVHEYMFVVDGRWVTDPTAEERRPDGFGRQNALLRL